MPRTSDGKPNLDGIWQAAESIAADLQDHGAGLNTPGRTLRGLRRHDPLPAMSSGEESREFSKPLQGGPARALLHAWNTADHVSRFPFQIIQTPQAVALVFEWSLVYRLIYMNGTPHSDSIDS